MAFVKFPEMKMLTENHTRIQDQNYSFTTLELEYKVKFHVTKQKCSNKINLHLKILGRGDWYLSLKILGHNPVYLQSSYKINLTPTIKEKYIKV